MSNDEHSRPPARWARPAAAAVVLAVVSAAARGQDDLAERVRVLETELQRERETNTRQSDRIRELELTLVSVTAAQDEVAAAATEEAIGRLVDEAVARIPRVAGPAAEAGRLSVRGQGRFVIRAFGNQDITTDESFEIEHLIVQLSLDLGDGFRLHATPAVSHTGGLSLITASMSYRAAPWLEIRAGRFLVPFNGIHAWAFPSDSFIEPYLAENSPRPFFYIPYWDEGILAKGTVPLGADGAPSLAFAAYVINGFDQAGLDGIHKRNIGDNNHNKTVGGRLAVDFDFGDLRLTVGTGGLFGKYDPDDRLAFFAVEADVELRYQAFSIYAEVFHRPAEVRGTVVENPAATVQDVQRLTGVKIRPKVRLFETFTLYAQIDWLQARQPPRTGGQFSVLELADEAATITTYVLGLEYEASSNLIVYVEGGLFERDPELGEDIPYVSMGLYTTF